MLDARGRVTSVKEYKADSTLYATTGLGYDDVDRLTSVTSSKGKTSTYTYDWLGWRTATSDPDTGSSSSMFDANGNTVTITDARGRHGHHRPRRAESADPPLSGGWFHGLSAPVVRRRWCGE